MVNLLVCQHLNLGLFSQEVDLEIGTREDLLPRKLVMQKLVEDLPQTIGWLVLKYWDNESCAHVS
jgi:hypothetical protein